MEILPALLTLHVTDLFQQIHKCSRFYNYFQIDIADGQFVPNTTVSLDEIGTYLYEENGASIYHSLVFDFHLMVNDFEPDLHRLVNLQQRIPIKTALIHVQRKPDIYRLHKEFPMFGIGLVLNPEDEVSELVKNYDIASIPAIQIMSVNPGKQGNPFIPEVLSKVEQLRKHNYRNEIMIDGGVNDKTLPLIISQNEVPDYAGIGSFISKAENLESRVREIDELIKKDTK
ncbi:MAG: hypothetical protein ACOCXQ_01755 [Patescibacteria group bacterium]